MNTSMEDVPDFTVVIVNFNGGPLLADCIDSVKKQDIPARIVVVDNESTDGSIEALRSRNAGLEIIDPGVNLGFAGGANFGARSARSEYLLFLNPDTSLEPGCLLGLREEFEARADLGICGPVLEVEAAGTVEFGATIDVLGNPIGLVEPRPPLYVSGCALSIRRSLFEELGGFDDRYFMFIEDIDLCWRALLRRADVALAPKARCRHVGGASTPGGYIVEGRVVTSPFRLQLRHRNTLATLLKCVPFWSLIWVTPAFILEAFALSALLVASGEMRAGWSVLRGVGANLRWLPTTLSARRRVRSARGKPDRAIRARFHKGIRSVELLRTAGIPRVWKPRRAASSDAKQ